jgi:hypothetical protein
MRKMALALLAGGAVTVANIAGAQDARVWTYQYLLATSQTERELAPITEHIIKERALHRLDLMDFAAEVLLARIDDPNYPFQNKLRLIRVLGAHEGQRYDALLTKILDRSTDRQLRQELRSAISKKGGGVSYVPGSVDIRALVAEVDAAALAAQPTTQQGEHLAKFPGGTIHNLFDWAGKPQQIVSGQTRVSDGILIHVKIQRLAFFYRGLGRVVYGYDGDDQLWEFQAVVADPMAFEQEFSYRDRARELGMPDEHTLDMMQLVSGYTASMKGVVERAYRRPTRSLEFMDTAAEILATQFETAHDPVTVDMYAWICRLLTQHGGPRYDSILARVASKTVDPKLRKFALLPFGDTDEVTKALYLPGTISLAAQRAKYPVLYPESTFQSGRL